MTSAIETTARQQIPSLQIGALDASTLPQTLWFITSWSGDDLYDRFGSAGVGGQEWLTAEITENGRCVLVAVWSDRVVGLLDYVFAQGAMHFGLVVDRHFRRLSIGTKLLTEMLDGRHDAAPVYAECSETNYAAARLLRRCDFKRVSVEQHEIVWTHA